MLIRVASPSAPSGGCCCRHLHPHAENRSSGRRRESKAGSGSAPRLPPPSSRTGSPARRPSLAVGKGNQARSSSSQARAAVPEASRRDAQMEPRSGRFRALLRALLLHGELQSSWAFEQAGFLLRAIWGVGDEHEEPEGRFPGEQVKEPQGRHLPLGPRRFDSSFAGLFWRGAAAQLSPVSVSWQSR